MRKVPRIKVACLCCGKEFETTQKRIDGGRGKFCSSSCTHRYIFTERNPRKKDRIARTCDYCGNLFYVIPYYAIDHPHRPARRFCSRDCEHAFHIGENNGNYKGNAIERICEICENHFFVKASVFKSFPSRCCSNKCEGERLRRDGLRAKENNHFFVHGNGRQGYTEDFERVIRPLCLTLHGFSPKSSRCIHHINYNSKDNRYINTIPLTRSDHGSTNIPKDRKAYEEYLSDWNCVWFTHLFLELGLLVFDGLKKGEI